MWPHSLLFEATFILGVLCAKNAGHVQKNIIEQLMIQWMKY